MSDTTVKFENIVTGEKIELSRRPAIEAYIKSGDLHKNARNYDLGWRVDPAVRAEWERRYNDRDYLRATAKEKHMSPTAIDMFAIIDFWLDEMFEIDELENRVAHDQNNDAQRDYLERVANAGKKPEKKAATPPAK
jgi:hypothetical protein